MTSSDSTERLKFSDLNGPYEPSFSVGSSRARGCYVTVVHGLIALVVVALLTLGVALIVYFAGLGSASVQCHCEPGIASSESACQSWMKATSKCE